jgi:hypothetical protein
LVITIEKVLSDQVETIQTFQYARLFIETLLSQISTFGEHMLPGYVIPILGKYGDASSIPMARKPRAKPIFRPHSKFTIDEDFKLRQLVNEHGPKAWRVIAKYLPGRNSRQCRERWLNYLNPALNTQPWTAVEDLLLEQTHAAIGPRWVYMMNLFPNRTDGMIKNRFMVLQRKNQRIAEGEKIYTTGSSVEEFSAVEPGDAFAVDAPSSNGPELLPMFEDPFGADFGFGPSAFSF